MATYLQLSLDGKLEKAFAQFRKNHACKTNSEGLRAMVRNLREYKELNPPEDPPPSVGVSDSSEPESQSQ